MGRLNHGRAVMATGKRLKQAFEGFDREHQYPPGEALAIVKKNATAKFDETIELHARLGLDVTKADQKIRGTVSLPKGTGKEMRVVVFAQADKAREAQEAGADEVGGQELADRIQGGWLEFDAAIATPDMMPVVGKLGKILGPRNLMPNPKTGTVTNEIAKTVREVKGGKIEYKTEAKQPNVHLVIGKASFPLEALVDNYLAVIEEIMRARPAAAKGKYIQSLSVSSTMGPGVRIEPNSAKDVVLPGDGDASSEPTAEAAAS